MLALALLAPLRHEEGVLDRTAIVACLREIAALLRMQGGNPFKVRAFERGAKALEASELPVDQLVEQGRLTDLKGIGAALAHQIEDLHRTGRSEILETLREGLPRGVLELAQVPGIGLHRLRELRERGIESVAALRAAAIATSDAKLLAAVERYEQRGTPVRLAEGLVLASDLERDLLTIDGVEDVRLSGELAGYVEVASELVLDVAASPEAQVAARVLPRFASTDGDVGRLPDGTRVHLRFGPREGTTRPSRVASRDLRGLIHCHTTWSDGRNTIEEMARAGEARGAEYISITDHSRSAHYAKGLTIDDLRRQWDEIAAVQERVSIRILRGTEADILADGALDWPDAILDELDVVIASIHSRHRLDEARMTERVVRAIRHPRFKIWGHPLGRLLGSRPPIPLRMGAVLDAMVDARVAVELNGDPARLDLPPEWIAEVRRRNVPFVLSSDAHSTAGLDAVRYAVASARHAAVAPGEVLNTFDATTFLRACGASHEVAASRHS